MIELGITPLHRIVAVFARRREATMRHWRGRAGKILLVTSNARQSAQSVVVVDVTVGALPRRDCVSSRQNKAGRAVVEARNFGVQPVIGRMTILTGGRELRFHMARVGRRGEVLQVTRVARRRHDLKFAVRAVFVAGTAVHGGVGARQREAVVVLFYILDRNLPSANRVALRTIRAQLALVNISMAVLALLTDV